MNIQEKIREEIAKELYVARSLMGDMPWSQARGGSTVMADLAYAKADQLLSYLHSQGVVVKVDKKLPIELRGGGVNADIKRSVVSKLIEAGCGFFEPLIKGENE